jgi:nucleoside-diphosphate-sugar epimerase
VLEGRRPTINGDGEQSRDFTYVKNVVSANLLSCTAPGVGGQVFNVACGDRITVNSMLQQINQITKKDIQPIYGPPRSGDIKHSQADVSRAKKLLGYEPKVSFQEGLHHTIEWYRENLSKPVTA